MQKKNLAKAAGALMFISILTKLVGFLRETLIAGAFGTTYYTDAYNVAVVVPAIMYGLFGSAITTTFIPLFSESYSKKGKEDAFKFANTILNIMFIISIILFIIASIFTPQIVKIVAPKFKDKTYLLAVALTKISVINIVLIPMNSCYTAILQSLDDFVIPALLGFLTSIPVIIFISLGAKGEIVGLITVVVIGIALQVIFQIPWLLKKGFRFSLRIDIHDPRLKRMLYLIIPILIGSGVSQINTLVDRNMASGLPDGSISALGFANEINAIVIHIFIAAVVTVIYPTLSRIGMDKDRKDFKYLISKSINILNMIVIPCAVGIMVLRIPIIEVLFKHGKFDDRSVDLTSGALLFYSIGLVFYGMRDILGKAFYAIQDTKTPMKNSIIGIMFNIALNILLVRSMGIKGLALATSTSAAVCSILLFINLKEKIGGINGKSIFSTNLKVLISSAVMGLAVYIIKNALTEILTSKLGGLLILIASTIAGIGVYLVMITLLKIPEFSDFLNIFRARFKKENM